MTALSLRSFLGILLIIVLVIASLVGGFVADMADRAAFTITLVSVFRDLRLV